MSEHLEASALRHLALDDTTLGRVAEIDQLPVAPE